MTDRRLDIRSTRVSDTAVFELAGDVDLAAVPELTAALATVDAARRVVVDLTDTTFLDSSAINGLIQAQRELALRGVSLVTVCPKDGIVRRALEITNVLGQLGVVDSRDAVA